MTPKNIVNCLSAIITLNASAKFLNMIDCLGLGEIRRYYITI